MMASVMRNSTNPAASRAESCPPVASPNELAMRADVVMAPVVSTLYFTSKAMEMMSSTATVSPSARPSPSIVPPMIPRRPKGRTTLRITPQRDPPRARAPSRSPSGAWEKTLRMTEQARGITIVATASPAIRAEAP